MSYEPTVYCDNCGTPFDVYVSPEERICTVCADGELKAIELPISGCGLRVTVSKSDGVWLHFAASNGTSAGYRMDALLDRLNMVGAVERWIKDRVEQAAPTYGES